MVGASVRLSRAPANHSRAANEKTWWLTIHFNDPIQADKAEKEGVLFAGVLLDAEPYADGMTVVRCYKCQQYSHIAQHCWHRAKCALCSGAAHADCSRGSRESESLCPHRATKKYRCANCGGNHAAFDRSCLAYEEQERLARERFLNRPRSFRVRGSSPPSLQTTAATGLPKGPEEGPHKQARPANQPVNRPPGRPRKDALPNPNELPVNQQKLRFGLPATAATPQIGDNLDLPSTLFTFSQDAEIRHHLQEMEYECNSITDQLLQEALNQC